MTKLLPQKNGDGAGEKGFTLVELMVVVTIIGVIAAIGIPRLFAYIRTSETAEVSQTMGRIMGVISAYSETQAKTAAAIKTELDGVELTPDGTGATELSDLIPQAQLAADSNFDYTLDVEVGGVGTPLEGEVVLCVKAEGRASASVPGGVVMYTSIPSSASGWDGRVNRKPYVTGSTDPTVIDPGGYCDTDGVAQTTCSNC